MEIGERLEPFQNLLEEPQRRYGARHAAHRVAAPCRLTLTCNAQIPIAPASESRFRTIEFLQRPQRR